MLHKNKTGIFFFSKICMICYMELFSSEAFFRKSRGKSKETLLLLQLANLSQCLLLDKTLYTLIRRLYKKIIAERSYTR